MKRCAQCETTWPDEFTTCARCSTALTNVNADVITLYCLKCGNEVHPSDCVSCGTVNSKINRVAHENCAKKGYGGEHG